MTDLTPETLADVDRIVSAWEATACSSETGAKFRAVLDALDKAERKVEAHRQAVRDHAEAMERIDAEKWRILCEVTGYEPDDPTETDPRTVFEEMVEQVKRPFEAAIVAYFAHAVKAEQERDEAREVVRRFEADNADETGRRWVSPERYHRMTDRAEAAEARVAALEAGINAVAESVDALNDGGWTDFIAGAFDIISRDLRALTEKGD